ncbi:MAG: acyl--CoA ligase [Deltaproteobacteria bacterium]|nr:acyl--CoA ligase [Deltaproteobacteria bacterium]
MSDHFVRLPRVSDYVDHWAARLPHRAAMIQHEDGKTISYARFRTLMDFFALRLLSMGIQPGERVASLLVLVPEHMALMYACFRLGIIFAPLDVRLKDEEVVRDINKIEPRAFFFLGDTPVRDFRTAAAAVRKDCPTVRHLVQFTADPRPGDILEGAVGITRLMDKKLLLALKIKDLFTRRLKKIYAGVGSDAPALIIFTTGTTGAPKPAVLTHRNIIVQNEVLARGLGAVPGGDMRILINLPPSHVGCVTECFMTCMALSGTAVMLRIFDPKGSLEAIQAHRVNALGMIPTQYRMLWALPDYDRYDLSSLENAVYAGSAGDLPFLRRLQTMAPRIFTGIGMTENAGFATMTPPDIPPEEMVGQVGRAFPDLAEVTIREPMKPDGSAGAESPSGEIGEICYHPPIVFAGYFNMPEETAKAVSREGILYTGDLGRFEEKGDYRALVLSGRRKFMIKQKGYNVFPDEVEDHIARMVGVATAEVVGMPHDFFDEGIVAFIQPQAGKTVTPEQVMSHCKGIASYKRPQHVVIWPANQTFPLTRTAKVDKLVLKERAADVITALRRDGGWDRQA